MEDIRLQFDETYSSIIEYLQALDAVIEEKEYNEVYSIKNYNNFIERLKIENLYTDVIENFIEDYMKYHNN